MQTDSERSIGPPGITWQRTHTSFSRCITNPRKLSRSNTGLCLMAPVGPESAAGLRSAQASRATVTPSTGLGSLQSQESPSRLVWCFALTGLGGLAFLLGVSWGPL